MVLKVHCSFCGKHHNDAKAIITMNGYHICDECVIGCEEIISEGKEIDNKKARVPIYEKLKEFNNVYRLTGSIFKSQ